MYTTFSNFKAVKADELNNEQREWYATALGNAIISDKVISEGQLSWIENVLHFLDDDERQSYIEKLKQKEMIELQPLTNITREEAGKIYIDLVLSIMEDFVIDRAEREFLIRSGQLLGIKKKRCEDVLNWANDLIHTINERKRFIDRIKRDLPVYPE